MPSLTPKSIYERSPSATYQTVAGEAIVIDLISGTYYSLNETGTWLWEHLDGRQTVAQLAQDLATFCEIPDQQAMVQEDLLQLLADLAREKLVVSAEGA